MSDIPKDLLFNSDHDWVRIEGDTGTCGITDYAQGELGDIVFLELPEIGDFVAQGESYGIIEAVKTVSDLIAPVSGEVIDVNTQLTDDAALVNDEPYGDGMDDSSASFRSFRDTVFNGCTCLCRPG